MKYTIFILLNSILFQSCKKSEQIKSIDSIHNSEQLVGKLSLPKVVKDEYQSNIDVLFIQSFNPAKADPFALLDIIAREDTTFGWIQFEQDSMPENWIRAEHIPMLIKKMDSEEIAFPVISSYIFDSYNPKGFSTIGNEAYYLILGFKNGSYSPNFKTENNLKSNEIYRLTPARKKAMSDWWAEYQE